MNRSLVIKLGALIIVVLVVLFAGETIYLRRAHSTFDNYYAFRGCTKLLEKTAEEGTCRLKSGEVIKLVKYQRRWFLDGDLPVCWHGLCL